MSEAFGDKINSHKEALKYISELGSGSHDLAMQAHICLVGLGCSSYVKTIYIGYDIDGVMTAALYAHVKHIEVAISLPNDFENKILVDASHLTWRTLPVAAIVENLGQMDSFIELATFAVNRVKDGSHSVHRDNDFFLARKGRRKWSGS